MLSRVSRLLHGFDIGSLPKQQHFEGATAYLIYAFAFLLGGAAPSSTALQNITLAMMVAIVLVVPALRARLRESVNLPISLAGLVFFAALILGCIWSPVAGTDMVDTLIKMRWLLLFPFLFAFFSNTKIALSALIGFSLMVLVSILLSIGLAATGGQLLSSTTGDWTVFRSHIYHNYFIALLVYGLLVSLMFHKLSRTLKAGLGIILVIALFDSFVLVQGRSGNVVMLALIGLLVMYRFRWKGVAGGAIALVLGILIMPPLIKYMPALHHSIERGVSNVQAYQQGQTETSLGLRLEFYDNSLRLIAAHPWLGYGTGSFIEAYRKLTGFTEGERATTNPHNDYFKMMIELGVLGLGVLMLLIFTVYRQAQAYPLTQRLLAYGLLFSMAFISVANSFFTDNPPSASFIVVLSALLAQASLCRVQAQSAA